MIPESSFSLATFTKKPRRRLVAVVAIEALKIKIWNNWKIVTDFLCHCHLFGSKLERIQLNNALYKFIPTCSENLIPPSLILLNVARSVQGAEGRERTGVTFDGNLEPLQTLVRYIANEFQEKSNSSNFLWCRHFSNINAHLQNDTYRFILDIPLFITPNSTKNLKMQFYSCWGIESTAFEKKSCSPQISAGIALKYEKLKYSFFTL